MHMVTSEAGDYETILGAALSNGIDPSLEPISAMLAELGDPDLRFRAIQLVGTNGKTSTARYAARILAAEGLKVGLYVSPLFMDYADQIEVEGAAVRHCELDRAVAEAYAVGCRIDARRAAAGLEPFGFSEFELLTAAAVLIFAWRGVDVAVVEAGMGGEWDATSAIRSITTVCVTGIGLDHTRFLGNTVEEIAASKAAVIRHGRACVLGPGTEEPQTVENVLLSRCGAEQVDPVLVRPGDAFAHGGTGGGGGAPSGIAPDEPATSSLALFDVAWDANGLPSAADNGMVPLEINLRTPRATYEGLRAQKPSYQAQNIACAATLAEEFLRRPLDVDKLRDAVATCPTPGRFDMISDDPPVIVDACHNPQSVEAFLSAWKRMMPARTPAEQPTLLCAIFADKDVDNIVAQLTSVFSRVVVVRTRAARAMDPVELAKVFELHGVMPEAVFSNVPDALRYLEGRPFVACGSITVAGEVAANLRA